MTLDFSQQAELDHLVRCVHTHQNWRPYVTEKAAWLAGKDPARWGFLPAALASALRSSASAAAGTPAGKS